MMQLERVLIGQQIENKRTKTNSWACSRKCQDTDQIISVVKAGISLSFGKLTKHKGCRFNISHADVCVTAGPEEHISHSH